MRERVVKVQCGDGSQRIKWLGSVGVARYDPMGIDVLGLPSVVRAAGGASLDMNAIVCELLKDGDHVWIMLDGT